MALLRGQNLGCVKQDRTLFENIEFSIEPSELLYVRGQNGAGKTSLLRILVGLADPSEGSIEYKHQDIQHVSESYFQDLVYFGHKLGLSLNLNGIENLRFWCQLNQVNCTESELFELLASLGLVGLEDVPVSQLSAGQQRRVALARLWLKTDAKLWILDEPFTALDVQGIALLRDKMIQHLSVGGAIIITSHQTLEVDYPTSELLLEYRI
ncbi:MULTISPECIES: cytochrome c biogenesis heme-transporting ATPase CcmA [Alteromonadaceae]|uniref:cytochrome c biogenesis heme-transporting ATPase CcmA n=1 Tax=Alteromonadaceae TaxID=72275 RepID=UPI001C08CBE4|nr:MULTISPECIES: cytochrome c biogenesis heme-transporting ATPase CcmA [Aliiglaciecola]MBU2879585.1 cytochrome c biogenesis heme-transporting ATPase CcmA [Aliiglaciecola lipolytica]MDO6710135.1 cytochrome c biogenesis heme-transporting ATPase CcmA [Aliiglaciecola sp. 2_MG-2023]MDO6751283.1 cytochrome c biogenesis heme-transporting ATPase CcmA [Aliiglaciecola sp. 1_MG-2023]